MKKFVLTTAAREDLIEILAFTIKRWGQQQKQRYNKQLKECFKKLAENPNLGHKDPDIDPALLRYHQGRHVIF